MGAVEDAIEIANGHVPRQDVVQVEVRNVRQHRGDGGLERFVGPEAVTVLDAPRGSGGYSQIGTVLAQVVRVPCQVVGQ